MQNLNKLLTRLSMLAICERTSIEIELENGSKFPVYAVVCIFSNIDYNPNIYADRYIVFVFLFLCLSICIYVSLFDHSYIFPSRLST